MTESYLDALRKIYNEVKIVGLPQSSGSSSKSDPLGPENIATAMVMYQHVMGGGGNQSLSNQDVKSLQQQVTQLAGAMADVKDAASKTGSGAPMDRGVRYLDDKALF